MSPDPKDTNRKNTDTPDVQEKNIDDTCNTQQEQEQEKKETAEDTGNDAMPACL
jgi:hypothetical protein